MNWRPNSHLRIVQIADIFTTLISFGFTYFIWINIDHKNISTFFIHLDDQKLIFLLIILVLSFMYSFTFYLLGAYSYQRFTSLFKEYSIIFRTHLICFSFYVISLFLVDGLHFSRVTVLIFFVIQLLFLIIQKTTLFFIAKYIRKSGYNRKKILIIGTGQRTIDFIRTVKNNFGWGLDIIGIISEDSKNIGTLIADVKVLNDYDNFDIALKNYNPEEVLITLSSKEFGIIQELIEVCERQGVQIRLISDFLTFITKSVTLDSLYGINVISLSMTQHNELQMIIKRLIDIIGALFALILYLPFMIIATIGIIFSDGFPILFSFNGFGYNKKQIRIFKFRTMVKDAEKIKKSLQAKNEMNGPVFKIASDPRIFLFGKFLRRWSIDETPQLFSVLKGDLSLVGPRQAMSEELENYQSWHRRRLSVKPGLTCLWQVQGRNKINNFDDWVKLDLEYIDTWNLWLDIKILVKTVYTIILGKGAY